MNPLLKEATTPTRRLQLAIRLALLPGLCGLYAAGALATALPSGTKLVFTDGSVGNCTAGPTCIGASWFSMEVVSGTVIYTGMQKGIDVGVSIGAAQPLPSGTASHGGLPYSVQYPTSGYTTDIGPIDTGWGFFCNTGLHFTTSAITATEVNATTQTLDFSGWRVTWNSIPIINMGGGLQVITDAKGATTYNNGTGLATLTCTTACTDGSSFTLAYDAIVPQKDPSGFGGTPYGVHLTGTLAYPANDPPTCDTVEINAQENTQSNWDPLEDDQQNHDTLTCEIVTGPLNGAATVADDPNSCGSLATYTPVTDYTGLDSFTYRVFDGTEYSGACTVTVDVSATPAPTAINDPLTATGTTPATVNVIANDVKGFYNIDPTSVVPTNGLHGVVVDNDDGTVTYTADAGFSGSDSFTYNVSDDNGTPQVSNDATVSVTVQANLPSSSAGTFAPGALAGSLSNTTGGGLTTADVGTDGALDQQCVGGCFDFAISGLAGADATVVLPLSAAIPSDPVYRKLIGGTWVDFDTASGTLTSAAAISTGPTVCPAPSPASYHTLVAGDYCIKMTIVNGGTNDADGADDDTVLDPGGIGVKTAAVPQPDTRTSGSSGCSVTDAPVKPLERGDWWVLAGFMAWLGAVVRRKHRG